MNNTAKEHRELRRTEDGSDSFMTGHHITRVRKLRDVTAPDWMYNTNELKRFLFAKFPRMLVDINDTRVTPRERRLAEKDRRMAGLWALVITRYFIDGENEITIEHDLGEGACPRMSLGVYRLLRRGDPRFRQRDHARGGIKRTSKRSYIGGIVRQIKHEAQRQDLPTRKS